MSERPRLRPLARFCSALLVLGWAGSPALAAPQGGPGTVASYRKISQRVGGVSFNLDQGDQFGRSVGRLGDLDGDGFTEIAIGAQNDDDGGTAGQASNVGAVWILFPNGTGAGKSITKISKTSGGFTGGIGDLDGFGRGLAGIGDFDGDGVGDLAVGASRDDDGGVNHGAVYVLLLNSDGTVKSHQKISDTAGGFTGTLNDNDEFGRDVASIGDLDGDGVTDLVVGAPLTNDLELWKGAIWILFLNPDATVKAHQKIGSFDGGFGGGIGDQDFFGLSVCGIGDVDGDGVIDIASGTPKDDDGGPRTGTVWILFMNPDGTVKSEQQISPAVGGLTGVGPGDEFGTSVSPMGDLDGDGVPDLVVGSILDDDGGTDRGAAYILFLYPNGTVKAQQKISTTEGDFFGNVGDDDWFGSGVSTLGDLNGDGISDLVVGARYDDDGNGNAGAIYNLILNGSPTTPPQPSFSASPRTGLVPLTVDFTDASGAGTSGWSWDFGDGGSSAVQHPTYEYAAPGTYTVSLTATGPGGSETLTKPDYIEVTALPPVADFSGTPLTGDAPLLVSFTDATTGWVSAWSWDFGDGGTSSVQDPQYTFAWPGTYTVALTATGPGGTDVMTKVDYVVADTPPPPGAEFSGTPTVGNAPLDVTFTDLSTSHISSWSWDFGDGGTSTERDPAYTYATPGTYTVSLQVTGLGGTDVATKVDYIVADTPPPPVADFTATPTTGDAPLDVVFTNLTVNHVATWSWDFGDGGTSSERNPTYTYAQPGTYTVSLTAAGLGGVDTETKVDYIVADTPAPPVTNFVGTPTSGDAPLLVSFSDLTTGHVTSWSWTFGDGGTSVAQNPAHQYQSAGTYTVTLAATGLGGTTVETKVDYIVANTPPPPTAGFYAYPLQGEAPHDVFYVDTSTGSYQWWLWDFGDGTQSFSATPVHTYHFPGTYTVSLTVTGAGGQDTLTRVDYILVDPPPPPVPDFVGAPTNGVAPLQVSFTDLTTGDVDTWAWTFGDGGTSGVQNPVYTYGTPGTYTVSLTASGLGGAATETKVDYVVVDTPPPGAEFSATPTNGVAPLDVSFTDLTTGDVSSWSWSFGDGGTSTVQNPLYTYLNPGTYTVSLTATGVGGADTETKVDYVVVDTPPPVAEFSGTPTTGDAPLDVSFTDLTTGDVSSWSWDFGDGGTSSVQHPSYRYELPGTYTVSLTATGAGGPDTVTKVDYIVAGTPPPPTVDFGGTPLTGDAPLLVTFDNLTTGQVHTWSWDFGDGGTSADPDPVYTYALPGTYTVSLTATGLGGEDTMVKVDYVVADTPAPPVADFSGTPTYGALPLQVQFTDLSTSHVASWSWDFGDGAVSSEEAPSHVYLLAGTYDVSLAVTGLGGSDAVTKVGYVVVEEAGLQDPSFENQIAAAPPAAPWTILAGSGHVINPSGVSTDGMLPTDGVNWLEVGAEDTNDATPPSNPGGVTLPPVGGAGVTQDFLYAAGASGLRFDAAFVRDGNASDPAFNDWMSIDVTDGVTTYNLYYADTFTPAPNVSAKYGLAMTDVTRVSVDLAQLFPGSSTSTLFTLTIQVGNGGDDQQPSRGYVDDFVFGASAGVVVRNGSGINPLVYASLVPPSLGTTWVGEIDAGGHPSAGLTTIEMFDVPLEGVFLSVGELLVALPPTSTHLFTSFAFSGGGVATHAIPLPPDLGFLGFTLYTQGVILGGDGPELTNAIDIRLGL